MATTTGLAPAGADAGPWLRGPAFDLTLILGVLVLALVLGGAATASPALFGAVLVVDLWLLAYPHVASTFTRVAFDREGVRRHWFLLFVCPPLVLAGTAGLTFSGGVIALNTLYYTWQSWHYTRQSYGIARAYHRPAVTAFGRHGPDRLSDAVIYAFPIWGLLHRSAQGNHQFYGMPLHCPQAPALLEWAAAAIAWALLLAWGWRALVDRREGRLRGVGPPLFVLSHVAITVVSYVLIDEITRGWLFINIWHNAQYLLFVWAANAGRFAGGVDPRRRWISRISQPDRIPVYALTCLAVGGCFYYSLGLVLERSAWDVLPLVLVVHMAVNFHHYLIDAVIWRRPRTRPGA